MWNIGFFWIWNSNQNEKVEEHLIIRCVFKFSSPKDFFERSGVWKHHSACQSCQKLTNGASDPAVCCFTCPKWLQERNNKMRLVVVECGREEACVLGGYWGSRRTDIPDHQQMYLFVQTRFTRLISFLRNKGNKETVHTGKTRRYIVWTETTRKSALQAQRRSQANSRGKPRGKVRPFRPVWALSTQKLLSCMFRWLEERPGVATFSHLEA